MFEWKINGASWWEVFLTDCIVRHDYCEMRVSLIDEIHPTSLIIQFEISHRKPSSGVYYHKITLFK